jgi:amidase
MDLEFATTTDLTQAIRERSLSSREVLDHLLGRVEQRNPELNAIVALDVERAWVGAASADAATARGEATGPLHGLPLTVKDVWETEGLLTTSGAPELKDYVPDHDAVAVGRLKAAGAVLFGKTNTPLYAGDFQTYNDVYGLTHNPWDLSRTAGGSSGGAAAAVAAGLTPLELGSDIGGSIRNPAHYNGIYGLKPSWGVIPTRGHIPGPPGSLVQVDVGCSGPLARSVDDLRLAFGVLAGPLPEDAVGWRLELDAGPPIRDVKGLRVATAFDEGADLLPIAGDVRAKLDGFAARLASSGAHVDEVPLPVSLRDGLRSWQELVLPIIGTGMPADTYAAFAALDDQPVDDSSAVIRAFASRYRTWMVANDRRQEHRAQWARFFEAYDVVLAPVMPTVAFPHDTERSFEDRVLDIDGRVISHIVAMGWCGAIGAVLLPVVTLPTGLSPERLPVGIQVIGPFLSDLRLLDIAGQLERAAGTSFLPPPG